MSKSEKLRKLANAVRRYRGLLGSPGHDGVVRWKQPPIPSAKDDVRRWLGRLGLDVEAHLRRVDEFPSLQQFAEWLEELENGNEHVVAGTSEVGKS